MWPSNPDRLFSLLEGFEPGGEIVEVDLLVVLVARSVALHRKTKNLLLLVFNHN